MTAPKHDDPRLGVVIKTDLAAAADTGHPPPADVVLVGFPFDEGCRRNGGRPGAAFGPAAVRQFLGGMGTAVNPEYGNIDLRTLVVRDAGDIAGETLEQAHVNLRAAVRKILGEGSIPFIIGGSNDQSAPNGLALLDYLDDGGGGGAAEGSVPKQKAAVVNVDAHLDVRPMTAEGLAHSGSPFRQLLEDGRLPGDHFYEFACQGNQCSAVHAQYALDKGSQLLWWTAVRDDVVGHFQRRVIDDAAAKGAALFVSFDIDAITGADCPGVSCPATFGITSDQAMQMALAAGRSPHVRLFDVSELNPVVEGYRSPRLVVNMFYHFLLGVAMRRVALRR